LMGLSVWIWAMCPAARAASLASVAPGSPVEIWFLICLEPQARKKNILYTNKAKICFKKF
ncbi:MAG: hypothetical protein U9P88_01270, partial [Patescibacteria group bacterium]|nr:hypothetical protein [Patescibacteria group bacterium]